MKTMYTMPTATVWTLANEDICTVSKQEAGQAQNLKLEDLDYDEE